MKKQLVILGIVVLLLVVGLSGCQEGTGPLLDHRFVGTWICYKDWYNYTITFTSDNRYESQGHIWGSGTYEAISGRLSLKMSNSNMVYYMNYNFSNNDQKFTLIYEDGSTLEFIIPIESENHLDIKDLVYPSMSSMVPEGDNFTVSFTVEGYLEKKYSYFVGLSYEGDWIKRNQQQHSGDFQKNYTWNLTAPTNKSIMTLKIYTYIHYAGDWIPLDSETIMIWVTKPTH